VELLPNTQRTIHFIHEIDIPLGELRTTVRRGHKWLEATGIVTLCLDKPRGSHAELGKAEIISTRLANFNKQTNEELGRNESYNVRRGQALSYNILRDEMRQAYPGFAEEEICTIITFKRTE
jgi:hypothetical protein